MCVSLTDKLGILIQIYWCLLLRVQQNLQLAFHVVSLGAPMLSMNNLVEPMTEWYPNLMSRHSSEAYIFLLRGIVSSWTNDGISDYNAHLYNVIG